MCPAEKGRKESVTRCSPRRHAKDERPHVRRLRSAGPRAAEFLRVQHISTDRGNFATRVSLFARCVCGLKQNPFGRRNRGRHDRTPNPTARSLRKSVASIRRLHSLRPAKRADAVLAIRRASVLLAHLRSGCCGPLGGEREIAIYFHDYRYPYLSVLQNCTDFTSRYQVDL